MLVPPPRLVPGIDRSLSFASPLLEAAGPLSSNTSRTNFYLFQSKYMNRRQIQTSELSIFLHRLSQSTLAAQSPAPRRRHHTLDFAPFSVHGKACGSACRKRARTAELSQGMLPRPRITLCKRSGLLLCRVCHISSPTSALICAKRYAARNSRNKSLPLSSVTGRFLRRSSSPKISCKYMELCMQLWVVLQTL